MSLDIQHPVNIPYRCIVNAHMRKSTSKRKPQTHAACVAGPSILHAKDSAPSYLQVSPTCAVRRLPCFDALSQGPTTLASWPCRFHGLWPPSSKSVAEESLRHTCAVQMVASRDVFWGHGQFSCPVDQLFLGSFGPLVLEQRHGRRHCTCTAPSKTSDS